MLELTVVVETEGDLCSPGLGAPRRFFFRSRVMMTVVSTVDEGGCAARTVAGQLGECHASTIGDAGRGPRLWYYDRGGRSSETCRFRANPIIAGSTSNRAAGEERRHVGGDLGWFDAE